MTVRVAINGFGLIGRSVLRAALMREDDGIDVVAVNDLADIETLAHLLKYDSVLGRLNHDVAIGDQAITVDDRTIAVFGEPDPSALPWDRHAVDIVIESTGRFTRADGAGKHITAGARKVIVSAPSPAADITIVMGINHDQYDPAAHTIVSNASCGINGLAPMVKVIHDEFGIASALCTIMHSYLQQNLLDGPPPQSHDLRRARAAAINIVPLDSAAVRNAHHGTSQLVPELAGALDGIGIRVPVPAGALLDMVVQLDREATAAQVNAAFRTASETTLKGILDYTEDPIVSSDVIASPASVIIDAQLTVTQRHQAKVIGWFDNVWGYANRLVDLTQYIGRSIDSAIPTDERTQ